MRTRLLFTAFLAVGTLAWAQDMKTPVPPTRNFDGSTPPTHVLKKTKGDGGPEVRELSKTVADAGANIMPLDGGKGSKMAPF